MRNTLLLMILSVHVLQAQDSTQVIYTQEADTLIKQRFIDKYENVFMTKVPTRHMLKVGLKFFPGVSSDFRSDAISNLYYQVGYEYKVAPAFSLGLNASINGNFTTGRNFGGTVSLGAQGRWYYDMARRITEGKNANNFSGNYVAAVFEKHWKYTNGRFPMTLAGLELGVQRRFLNYGWVDFAIRASYQKFATGYLLDVLYDGDIVMTDFNLTTRTSFGLAFGDWRKARPMAVCELLRCDQFLNSQFKILWPVLSIGTRIQKGTIGVGYERKLGRSPVSVNTQIFADFQHRKLHFTNPGDVTSHYFQIQPSMEVRYYYLQRKKIRNGSGGNNLSGIYVGPYTTYLKFNSTPDLAPSTQEHLGLGVVFGYQKTLFQNVYFDVSGAMSWNLLKTEAYNSSWITTIRMGFGLAI